MAIQGGRAPLGSNNFRYYLTKPYDLAWPPTAEQWLGMDQMFVELYDAGRVMLTTLEEGEVIDSETGEANSTFGTAGETILAIKDITAAQVKALTTTPVEIIPAPGAGLVLVPIFWSVCHSASVAFNADVTAVIQHTNSPTVDTDNIIIVNSGSTGPRLGYADITSDSSTISVTNSALELSATTGVPTLGEFVNDTMRLCLVYATVEAPF